MKFKSEFGKELSVENKVSERIDSTIIDKANRYLDIINYNHEQAFWSLLDYIDSDRAKLYLDQLSVSGE